MTLVFWHIGGLGSATRDLPAGKQRCASTLHFRVYEHRHSTCSSGKLVPRLLARESARSMRQSGLRLRFGSDIRPRPTRISLAEFASPFRKNFALYGAKCKKGNLFLARRTCLPTGKLTRLLMKIYEKEYNKK